MIDGIAAGTTSYVMTVMAYDSSSTVGAGKTGITYNGGITFYYKRSNGTASVACTINTITTLGTYNGSATNAAWKEVDSTHMPGVYEVHIPNNAFASGATDVMCTLILSGVVPIPLYFRINPPADIQTALGTAITCTTGGIPDVNAKNINNATAVNGLTAAQIATGVWTDSTAGDFTTSSTIGKSVMNGVSLGTGLTVNALTNAPTAGDLTATMKSSVTTAATSATPTVLLTSGTSAGQVTLSSGILTANANGDFTATQKTSLNNATPASVTGAVGSVTGAVGSVTGNVGGNVTGSVGSIASGGINNAAFNADVASTAYASNTLAQMMYKFFDNAFTGYSDGSTFTSDGLLDRLTKVMWIMRNKVAVTDASGNTTIYKDDNSTGAFTVASALTDDSTTTTRLRMA